MRRAHASKSRTATAVARGFAQEAAASRRIQPGGAPRSWRPAIACSAAPTSPPMRRSSPGRAPHGAGRRQQQVGDGWPAQANQSGHECRTAATAGREARPGAASPTAPPSRRADSPRKSRSGSRTPANLQPSARRGGRLSGPSPRALRQIVRGQRHAAVYLARAEGESLWRI